VIPGINTNMEEMAELAEFIAKELGKETPWHISRYFPAYKFFKTGATSVRVINQIEEIGRKAGLQFVYTGNMTQESVTKCPECHQDLIIRWGNSMTKNIITLNSTCPSCDSKIPGLYIN
ncbi:MAG: hypothetical protein MUO40_14565, partial [Anaerolineaceae bacterium]|nr:hypothetical protein [Anaerolineaceae bacterium]